MTMSGLDEFLAYINSLVCNNYNAFADMLGLLKFK